MKISRTLKKSEEFGAKRQRGRNEGFNLCINGSQLRQVERDSVDKRRKEEGETMRCRRHIPYAGAAAAAGL